MDERILKWLFDIKIAIEEIAVTIKPLYKAAIIFFDFPRLTKKVPKIDVSIHEPPIVNG